MLPFVAFESSPDCVFSDQSVAKTMLVVGRMRLSDLILFGSVVTLGNDKVV